jgi:hypothetical protein
MRKGGGGGSVVSGEIELNVTSLHSCYVFHATF